MISIVAILVALLLPALASSRATALTIACAAQQRQIHLGLTVYASDHNGLGPVAIHEPLLSGSEVGGPYGWKARLSPYVGKSLDSSGTSATNPVLNFNSPQWVLNQLPIFQCPRSWTITRSPDRTSVSYGINTFVTNIGAQVGVLDPSEYANPLKLNGEVRRLQPSDTLLLADYRYTKLPVNPSTWNFILTNFSLPNGNVHPPDTLNFLMYDGHMESRRRSGDFRGIVGVSQGNSADQVLTY